MIRRLLAAGGLAAALVPATSAHAVTQIRYARFKAKITGAQTTRWTSLSGTYTDCNGTRQTKGEGTEVVRFDSGKPEKVLVQVNPGGSTFWKFGTWDAFGLDDPLGLLSQVRVTRHGTYVTTSTGGECGHPAPVTRPDPGDCGRRRGVGSAVVGPYGRRLKVELIPTGFLKGFDDCPVSSPTGIDDGQFTTTYGRLSTRLLLSGRRRIVVEDGKLRRRHEPSPGTDATSTTHFRLVLVRKRGR